MAKLILVRHGKSEWNKLGLWTGWTDISLAEEGVKEAEEAGVSIKKRGIKIDKAYCSVLKRTKETLDIIEKSLEESISEKIAGS